MPVICTSGYAEVNPRIIGNGTPPYIQRHDLEIELDRFFDVRDRLFEAVALRLAAIQVWTPRVKRARLSRSRRSPCAP
jgi:hypothetical protein